MARRINVTETATAVAATYTVTLGAHVANDLLLVCLTQDGGGTAIAPNAAAVTDGWAMIGTQAASQNSRQAWAYKIASGSSTTNPTFTGANDDWFGTCLVYREVDTTTPIEGWMRSDWGNSTNISTASSNTIAASSAGGTTVITPSADSLIVYSWGCDGNGAFMRTKLADMVCDSKRASTNDNIGHIIGHNQLASASVPAITMYAKPTNEGGNGWVLSIKNASGGTVQKQARVVMNENTGCSNWFGDFGATQLAVTWAKPSTFVASAGGAQTITINGTAYTVSDTALGTPTTNSTQAESPWGTLTGIANADNATVIAGATHTFSAENIDGKIVYFEWEMNAASSNSRIGTEGVICGFASSDGNYVIYQLRTKAAGWSISQPFASFIDLGNATELASLGTVDLTNATRFFIGWHRVAGSTSADNIFIKNFSVISSVAITGGGDDEPADFQTLPNDLTSWGHYKIAELQGSSQVLGKFNVQIGNGTHYTYFDSSASSFEYPRAFGAIDKSWNVDPSRVTLSVYAKSGDTINLAAGVAASETLQSLSINASSSTGATYSFAGLSAVGWSATWLAGVACANATFKNSTINFKGAAPNTVSISKPDASVNSTTGAVCSFDANSSLTNSSISCVKEDGTNAGYHIELGTAVTAFTLTDVTFTGTPTTDKIHVLKTTGTVTITIAGSTSLVDADVTSAGATVVIAAPQPTLSATVLASSRVVLYNNTTNAELDNTAPAGTSWSKVITSGASANDSLTLHVFKEGYQEFSTTFLYTGDDATILVTQAVDSNIASLRTELGITDYTTITEFALDITGSVEIDADDADGSTTKARLAIWYNGVLTTENGARYLRGAITILSTAAFRINTSVLDLKIENISATFGLNFTDTERRLYRDDGAPIYAAVSAPGSIQNDYSGVPDTVETGVSGLTGSESAQLMALPTATTIAAAVWAYVVTGSTTAVQMMRGFAAVLLGKVSGAGTGTETFRDIADTTDVVVATVDSDGNRTAITRDLT